MNDIERYNSIVKPTTPRLVFDYECEEGGKESLKWGMHGLVPTQLLIAAMIRAQVKLSEGNMHTNWFERCPETKLVIAWPSMDPTVNLPVPVKHHKLLWFLHPSVPMEPLLTMLEVAKSTILASMLMRQQQEQQAQKKVVAYRSDGQAIN